MSRSAEPLAEFLERIRARLATIPPDFADRLRYRVRLRCEADGAPIPEWAERRARGAAGEKRSPAPVASAAPVSLPPELSAWRAAHPGSVVAVSRSGVALLEFGAPPRRFPTVEAAIAAV